MYCEDCKKRSACTKICDDLELHLRRDIEVSQRHFIPRGGLTENYQSASRPKTRSPKNACDAKVLIITLYNDGMKQVDILYHVPHSKGYISKTINEYKNAFKDPKINTHWDAISEIIRRYRK